MELKLEQEEVRKILLAWGENQMPGRFNTVVFSSYGKEVTLTFENKKVEDKKEIG